MSKDVIQSVFHVEQFVTVVNKNSPYYMQSGIVERLGAAGNIVYVHVRIGPIMMTFHEQDLETVN